MPFVRHLVSISLTSQEEWNHNRVLEADTIEPVDVSADEPGRRMGAPGSTNWGMMLDAAEAILCEEGYGALSSRRVAEKAGFKQRLVYYYFRSMDELAVEMFVHCAAVETVGERIACCQIGQLFIFTFNCHLTGS